jgi:hypothetical protein
MAVGSRQTRLGLIFVDNHIIRISSTSPQRKSGNLNLGEIKAKIDVCRGHAVAHLVEALRYKPEGCGFDS